MEDFPIWMKALVYIIVGGTIIYAIAAALYSFYGGTPV
jgi:hypothetical protein